MALYIEWKERSAEFDHWDYVGGGITAARMRDVIVTKRVRWSTEETLEMRRRANDYIRSEYTDRPGAKVVAIPD